MHYFTSITANYIPKARVLARSVKGHNPGAAFHLVLADRWPEGLDKEKEPFDSILFLSDLGIEDLDRWVFKHSVVELCTAVKGAAFLKIFQDPEVGKVVYLDPDIWVLHDLGELSRVLDRHEIVLTPHQVEPDTGREAIIDNEVCSLKHGVFNLGFLAIRRGEEGMRFLRWWADRLLEFCYDDIPNGLFTDQRWVDLAPAFFDVHVLRDKTYNVATWNLTHRQVAANGTGRPEIEGSPIKFFHFSGFDSGDQEVMLKKYAPGNKALFQLRKNYIDALKQAGQEELGRLPCVYGVYSNGETISQVERKLYRSRWDLMEAFPEPAVVKEDKHCFYWWFRENREDEALLYQRELTERERRVMELRNSRLYRLARKVWGIVHRLHRFSQMNFKNSNIL
jgi:hypothetical protein